MATLEELFESTVEQETTFLYLSVPSYVLGLAGNLILLLTIATKPSLHKPRHIFQVSERTRNMRGLSVRKLHISFSRL